MVRHLPLDRRAQPMPENTPKASAAIFDCPTPSVPAPEWLDIRPPNPLCQARWYDLLVFGHAPMPWNPGFWREVSSGR